MATTTAFLLERIYELLVDGAGTARQLAKSERFARLRASTGDPRTLSARARVQPLVEARITELSPEQGPADELHSDHHYRFVVMVQRWYFLGHESDPASVEKTFVRVADDLMRTRAVLCHPSNLLRTVEDQDTGIGGPALVLLRSRMLRPQQVGEGADRLLGYMDEYEASFAFSPDA